jgi:hypothetical protein
LVAVTWALPEITNLPQSALPTPLDVKRLVEYVPPLIARFDRPMSVLPVTTMPVLIPSVGIVL